MMTKIEEHAIYLRRKISEKELSGGMNTSDAVRLMEALQEIELRLLVDHK